jgi:DNA modification methylase
MNPYYQDEYATIYRGDCREILPGLPTVDLVLADPPYGIKHPTNYMERGRANLVGCSNYPEVAGDSEPFDPTWLLAYGRGRILWGGGLLCKQAAPRLWLASLGQRTAGHARSSDMRTGLDRLC